MPPDDIDRHPGFPGRASLRPGVRVVRRAVDQLQVGIGPDAVVLPDHPSVRLLLRGLEDGRSPAHPALLAPSARHAAETLLLSDLVVDADVWCAALEGAPDSSTRSALVAEARGDTARRIAARRQVRVGLHASGLISAADALAELLGDAGVATAPPDRADVVAVLTEGEPDRALLDQLMVADRPHLLLIVCEGGVRVGPFVQPGRTACQRCLDAHAAERDPRRALVLEQYAGPSRPLWGLPAPVPGDLVTLATAIVARDLARWADVLQPATWSTTIRVDPELTFPRTTWSRHAACGCSSNIRTA